MCHFEEKLLILVQNIVTNPTRDYSNFILISSLLYGMKAQLINELPLCSAV